MSLRGMPVLASPLRVRDGRPGGRTGRAAIEPLGRTGRVATLVADGQDGYTYIWDG